MRDPPSDVIASWPEPNLENPQYQGPQLIIVGVTLIVISCVALGLRVLVRVRMKKTAGWDDWIMVAAMPIIIGSTACSIIGTDYGWGYHIWDIALKPEWGRTSRLLSWINQLLYLVIMTLVRVSLLTSYLRFSTTDWFSRFSWLLIFINIAWGVAFTISLLLACKPLNLYWDSISYEQNCDGEEARIISASIISIVADIFVFSLPLSTFWKLRLPMREKIVLFTLMSIGLVACVSSIVRTFYISRTLLFTYDVTWDGYTVWMWTVVEINLAVICASIPTLRPFARKYLPNLGFKRSTNESRLNAVRISDWPRSPSSGMEMGFVSNNDYNNNKRHTPIVRMHQEIPSVSSPMRPESNSSENSADAKGSFYLP